MFYGQAEAAGAAGAQVQPVRATGEKFVGQGIGEGFVIDAEVFVGDAGFGDAGGASCFKRKHRFMFVELGDPAADGASAEPLVFEETEFIEVRIGVDVAEGIQIEGFGALDPEGGSGFGAEVPVDYFAGPGV